MQAGEDIYALPGGDSKGVYDYDQNGGQWIPMGSLPQNITASQDAVDRVAYGTDGQQRHRWPA